MLRQMTRFCIQKLCSTCCPGSIAPSSRASETRRQGKESVPDPYGAGSMPSSVAHRATGCRIQEPCITAREQTMVLDTMAKPSPRVHSRLTAASDDAITHLA
jgi:hypothetical protein